MSRRQNATREQIAQALRTGLSDSAVAAQLGCDRHRVSAIRKANGLPKIPRQTMSLEEKWRSYTRPADGGHLVWTGERQATSGTPVMRYREVAYTAAAVAFRIQHGREPEGYVVADCGMKHCVAPEHVEDTPMRQATRAALRAVTLGRPRPDRCRHGHDQTVHGRYETDGRAYCGRCKSDAKRRAGAS